MIVFQNSRLPMPAIDRKVVAAWIRRVAATYGKQVGDLGYVFCDDEEILDVNIKYLGHDYFTDIITFDYSSGHVVSGDMYISLDTVRTNSEQFVREYDTRRFRSVYEAELHRVIIHGVLHLCGINDKGPGEREIMEECENQALALLPLREV
ncbi:MAG: rRNA maturation RNase YbeY [Bacteroidaceae bacterium]|nr:rRNA maturation RNase YbeY [Bacteroidaceae bacterium]